MMIDLCSIRLFGPIDEAPVVQDTATTRTSTSTNSVEESEVFSSDSDSVQEEVKRSLNDSAASTTGASSLFCKGSSSLAYDQSDAAVVADGSSSSSPLLVDIDVDNSSHHRPADIIEFYKGMVPGSDATEQSACSTAPSYFETSEEQESKAAFTALRCNYLLVTLAVMLADGLQGTHLYVLYESYGFSVASLYAVGFAFGAITTPITGPLIDKFGRKKSALLYCILEIGINMLEQYPFLSGLIVSRVVGGVTTNLLSSVFETWLDTEYRRRGIDNAKYEIIMRDSVIVSNIAAIASGYLAHVLAERFGPVGPFQGAVTCTGIALVVIFFLWNENYGGTTSTSTTSSTASSSSSTEETASEDSEPKKSMFEYGKEAYNAFRNDSRVLRVGIIQGLTVGSLQIFIFLWSPTLQTFSTSATAASLGLDKDGEPAYGLIFGAFMAAGVAGGLLSPYLRKATTALLSPLAKKAKLEEITIDGEEVRPMAVEFLVSACYILSAALLAIPCVVSTVDESSFSLLIVAFLSYEFLVGIILPCEGVIRSLYLPSDARASMMTLPRIIVNLAVAIGVIITRHVTTHHAYASISLFMAIAAILQLSLISKREWDCLFGKVDKIREHASERSREFHRSSSRLLQRMLSVASTQDDAATELEVSNSKKID